MSDFIKRNKNDMQSMQIGINAAHNIKIKNTEFADLLKFRFPNQLNLLVG
jgi:hypothetical protein